MKPFLQDTCGLRHVRLVASQRAVAKRQRVRSEPGSRDRECEAIMIVRDELLEASGG